MFDEIRERGGEAEAELHVKAAFGVIRRLRARFRRVLEPPRRIVYIGEGNFVMTIDMELSALTPTETRLELVMQLSASFLVESALNYRMNLALEDFGTRLQEAIVAARRGPPAAPAAPEEAVEEEKAEVPAAPPAPPAPAASTPTAAEEAGSAAPEPSCSLEECSERLADILVVSELLLNSRHIRSLKTRLGDPEELVREATRGMDGYVYITINVPSKGYLARVLAWRGRIVAVTLEGGGGALGKAALEKLAEASGAEAEVSVLEPPVSTVSKIIGS